MTEKLAEELIPTCPEPNKDGLIWKDVSSEIKLMDGKANPFGWSQYRMEWKGKDVGWLESGSPEITGKDFQMAKTIDPADNIEHVFFFKGLSKEDWEAVEFMDTKK